MKPGQFARSFGPALRGVLDVARTQRNWQVQAGIAMAAVGAGLVFGIPPSEWALLALTIGVVLGLETMNTAVESAVDAIGGPRTAATRQAKDAAAGAVLIAAVAAVGVGAAIFGPRVLSLLH